LLYLITHPHSQGHTHVGVCLLVSTTKMFLYTILALIGHMDYVMTGKYYNDHRKQVPYLTY